MGVEVAAAKFLTMATAAGAAVVATISRPMAAIRKTIAATRTLTMGTVPADAVAATISRPTAAIRAMAGAIRTPRMESAAAAGAGVAVTIAMSTTATRGTVAVTRMLAMRTAAAVVVAATRMLTTGKAAGVVVAVTVGMPIPTRAVGAATIGTIAAPMNRATAAGTVRNRYSAVEGIENHFAEAFRVERERPESISTAAALEDGNHVIADVRRARVALAELNIASVGLRARRATRGDFRNDDSWAPPRTIRQPFDRSTSGLS
jgi:hypothetical protein